MKQTSRRGARTRPFDTQDARAALDEKQLSKIDCPADGNCFFYAVSMAVYGIQSRQKGVRSAICDYLEEDRERFSPFFSEPLGKVVKEYRKNGTYDSSMHVIVAAAAELYERPLEIYESTTKGVTLKDGFGEYTTKFAGRTPIRLAYDQRGCGGAGHYDFLRGPDSDSNRLKTREGVFEKKKIEFFKRIVAIEKKRDDDIANLGGRVTVIKGKLNAAVLEENFLGADALKKEKEAAEAEIATQTDALKASADAEIAEIGAEKKKMIEESEKTSKRNRDDDYDGGDSDQTGGARDGDAGGGGAGGGGAGGGGAGGGGAGGTGTGAAFETPPRTRDFGDMSALLRDKVISFEQYDFLLIRDMQFQLLRAAVEKNQISAIAAARAFSGPEKSRDFFGQSPSDFSLNCSAVSSPFKMMRE